MMGTLTTARTSGTVQTHEMSDGLLIRLGGQLGTDELPLLRRALLGRRPDGCTDVMVDAGEVAGATDDALAILVAAAAWAMETGAQLRYSRLSPQLAGQAGELGLAAAFPGLEPVGSRPQRAGLTPIPRAVMAR